MEQIDSIPFVTSYFDVWQFFWFSPILSIPRATLGLVFTFGAAVFSVGLLDDALALFRGFDRLSLVLQLSVLIMRLSTRVLHSGF